MFVHQPVLLKEALDGLNIDPDGVYLDLTLGYGGHSSEILSRLSPKGKLIAFDQDIEAINNARKRLQNIGCNFVLIHDNFRNLKEDLHKINISSVSGILMDLGVSSPQFDCTERGFSYRGNAKLDMRMDTRQSLKAYDVINTYSLKELTRVFREYGEDRYAYPIAKRIVNMRSDKEIATTEELVSLIKSVKPMKELAKKGHPAKQIFQALRIEVNDELNALQIAVNDALEILNPKGRLVIISFQSLEDRLIKRSFRAHSVIEGSRFIPTPSNEQTCPKYRLITKKPILPSEEETKNNPRSHSAKLRIIERKEQ